MSAKNLTEQFLYALLPDAVLSQDERGYVEGVVSGFQDRLDDLRSYANKLNAFWEPGALPTGASNAVLVDLTSEFGKAFTRSLDIQADTPPDGSSRLSLWAAKQLNLPLASVSNVRYGYDALRAVDADTLGALASTLGTLLYKTSLLSTDATERAAQVQLVSTWFPRLRIKGTAQSFEVLGRILGFDDVKVTPLWSRLSARVPNDIGNVQNDSDFAPAPEYYPHQDTGPLYDPLSYRDGAFFSWSGVAGNGTSSTDFYTETVNGFNPWIEVVLLGSLAGSSTPSVSSGTVTHPATGTYALSGGAPYVKAWVDPTGSSVRFQALAEGESFNGLVVNVDTVGTLATLSISDRLSSVKYRSSYFDLSLTADMDKIEQIFGSRAAAPNKDLKADPVLTSDGTAVSPYRPWVSGSVAQDQVSSDWLVSVGDLSTVIEARRQADPALPSRDRQLNMDGVIAAGVQVTQAFEEVRAATRFPRRSLAGILIENSVCYAPYTSESDLFTTTGALGYSGSSYSSPLPGYVAGIYAKLPVTSYVQWTGEAGSTYVVRASYDAGPYAAIGTVTPQATDTVTFYDTFDPALYTTATYEVLKNAVAVAHSEGLSTSGTIYAQAEINPAAENQYLYRVTDPLTTYGLSGSYDFSSGSYAFATSHYPGVVVSAQWTLITTETIRPEPSVEVKSTGTEGSEDSSQIGCLSRPEDEEDDTLVYEMVDDYPWLREVTVGGELVDLDVYTTGTELGVQALEEATAFNDQTGVDIDVYGIPSALSSHPRITWQARSTSTSDYQPAYTAVGYSGVIKDLASLTNEETSIVRPTTGASIGDTEGDYDVMFEPGYALYHVGLAQGVLVADVPKFFGAHHSDGLVGWFAFNEHVDDNLTVIDHSCKATPTSLQGVDYLSRLWDDDRGWVLNLGASQVWADEYRDVVDDMTVSFWIKLGQEPTQEVFVVTSSPIFFSIRPGGIVTGYSIKTNQALVAAGSGYIGDGNWHFVYVRRSATNATFGIGTLASSASENNVPASYMQADADADTLTVIGNADSDVQFGVSDLRIWNTCKTQDAMDLVRYHAPTPTLCQYRLGFAYTTDRQDKYGLRVLPSGWACLDVLPAWYRRSRQGVVLRYNSMGSYIGEDRRKETGIGDQRPVPATYKLGYQFVTLTADGTAPFSTEVGQLPGWNSLWQVGVSNPQFEVLPMSGSTATGIAPVYTSAGTVDPWPPNAGQVNPFREHVFVPGLASENIYKLSIEQSESDVRLRADLVVRGRSESEVAADPYIAQLIAAGTVYYAFGTGFIQGTLTGDTGTYGFYDPVTAGYLPKTFSVGDLAVSEQPTGPYVQLCEVGNGILCADEQTMTGTAKAYSGTDTSSPLYMYSTGVVVTQCDDANTTWTDRYPLTDASLAQQDVDVTALPSLVTVDVYGTHLNTPCLGKNGVMEFDNTGNIYAGNYLLTIVSGQIGQADVDFTGFAVGIDVNGTPLTGKLLSNLKGYNFRGTDTFSFAVADESIGNWSLSIALTNALEDANKGTKRQLAVYSYQLKRLVTELFEVTVTPTTEIQIDRLYTDNFSVGTTPGGWFRSVSSYGTSSGFAHESDIYPSNDTVESVLPLADTLTGLTNDRLSDVIYAGVDVLVAEEGSYSFPTFGSLVAAPVSNPPVWAWSGGVTTDSSVEVSVMLTTDTSNTRLAVSKTIDFGTCVYSDYVSANASQNNVARYSVEGLDPWTPYYYAVENGGVLDTSLVGRVTTFGTGATSFKFGIASCENNVFGASYANTAWPLIEAHSPLFFMHTGDFHYNNITTNNPDIYRTAFTEVLAEPTHTDFWKKFPVVYMWDDHDYGANDSDSTSPSRSAARQAFREIVPHYPLAAGIGDSPVYFTFSVGRCRFIVTDNRSERTPATVGDSAAKTMLGSEQKAWFKEQLLVANADPDVEVIFWVNSVSWTGIANTGENWSAYPTERAEIANFIKDNDIRGLFILCGDMHSAAIDDGRSYDFTSDGTNPVLTGNGLPVFQAAPLAQTASTKGTPYMIGPYMTTGFNRQFGIVNVMDSGSNVLVNFTAYDGWTGTIVHSGADYVCYTLNGTASPRP